MNTHGSAHVSPFDAIKRHTDEGMEYWSGRDRARLLGYKDWRNFTKAVTKAIEAGEPLQAISLKPPKSSKRGPQANS
jgi:hypothetical protein